jgi:uncharacterized protein (DUF488 family)
MSGMAHTIWTIGHSTRPIEELIELLTAHEIARLVDVRTIPRSRYNPQFNREALGNSLEQAGLRYAHEPKLGGLRKSRPDSINTGWKNASFRGYADYMQTDEFRTALDELMAASRKERIAIMCAEAVPWRCHRSLISDALVSRGWTVRHIMTTKKTEPHILTTFAKLDQGILTYPSNHQGNL